MILGVFLLILLVLLAYVYFKKYDLILETVICRYKCALRDPCTKLEEVEKPEILDPSTTEPDDDASETPGSSKPSRIISRITRPKIAIPIISDQPGTSDDLNCSCTHYACQKFEKIGRILDPFAYGRYFDQFTDYFCHAIEKVVESKDSQTNIVFGTPEKRRMYLKVLQREKELSEERRADSQRKYTSDGSKKSTTESREEKFSLASSTRRTSNSSTRRSSVSEKDKTELKLDSKRSEKQKYKNTDTDTEKSKDSKDDNAKG